MQMTHIAIATILTGMILLAGCLGAGNENGNLEYPEPPAIRFELANEYDHQVRILISVDNQEILKDWILYPGEYITTLHGVSAGYHGYLIQGFSDWSDDCNMGHEDRWMGDDSRIEVPQNRTVDVTYEFAADAPEFTPSVVPDC